MTWTLTSWDPEVGMRRDVELGSSVDGTELELRPLRGASAIHLEIREDGSPRLRAEIPSDEDDEVSLRLMQTQDGEIDVETAGGRQVIDLPAEGRYRPPDPLHFDGSRDALDLALVIDATLHLWLPESRVSEGAMEESDEGPRQRVARRLFQHDEAREHFEDDVLGMLADLAESFQSLRVALLAFGDEGLESGSGEQRPSFHLAPKSGLSLRPFDERRVRRSLRNLRHSSGGDLVDAVGDALAAAAELRFKSSARRAVVLLGDSPGHSLRHPIPGPSDALARRHDVDVEARGLYKGGCALASIYFPPPDSVREVLEGKPQGRETLSAIENQYRRLATAPELFRLASESVDFEEADAAELPGSLASLEGTYARGPALPLLVSSKDGS